MSNFEQGMSNFEVDSGHFVIHHSLFDVFLFIAFSVDCVLYSLARRGIAIVVASAMGLITWRRFAIP